MLVLVKAGRLVYDDTVRVAGAIQAINPKYITTKIVAVFSRKAKNLAP